MEIWTGDLTEADGGDEAAPRKERRLSWLLTAACHWRRTGKANRRWRKAIRSLHAECDQLRRRMERAR